MKRPKKEKTSEAGVLQEAAPAFAAEAAMVRTQIYLTRAEHDFLQSEARRRNEPMSAVLRGIIDEKMTIPEDAWTNNPLLRKSPKVKGWKGRRDGSINHDHYVYGAPKKYHEVNGEWVPIHPEEI
jgi:hypothetical protein